MRSLIRLLIGLILIAAPASADTVFKAWSIRDMFIDDALGTSIEVRVDVTRLAQTQQVFIEFPWEAVQGASILASGAQQGVLVPEFAVHELLLSFDGMSKQAEAFGEPIEFTFNTLRIYGAGNPLGASISKPELDGAFTLEATGSVTTNGLTVPFAWSLEDQRAGFGLDAVVVWPVPIQPPAFITAEVGGGVDAVFRGGPMGPTHGGTQTYYTETRLYYGDEVLIELPEPETATAIWVVGLAVAVLLRQKAASSRLQV